MFRQNARHAAASCNSVSQAPKVRTSLKPSSKLSEFPSQFSRKTPKLFWVRFHERHCVLADIQMPFFRAMKTDSYSAIKTVAIRRYLNCCHAILNKAHRNQGGTLHTFLTSQSFLEWGLGRSSWR